MKRIVNEIVVILVLVIAMYLISTSDINDEQKNYVDSDNKNAQVINSNTSKKNIYQEKARYEKLKKAKEELQLYRLYKKRKLIVGVNVIVDETSIDINTSNAYELSLIKGIGKTLSNRIVEYRIENGIFNDVHNLIKVKGIGEKKLSNILNN